MSVKKYKDDPKGNTHLFGGSVVSKSSNLVEVYGTVDELNSIIGLARSAIKDKEIDSLLHKMQINLFDLGSDLSSPMNKDVKRISQEDIKWIEEMIEKIDKILPPLKNFILPGGSQGSSILHLARSVCRRAERKAVLLIGEESVNQLTIKYLNRLSDFLFYLARWINHKEQKQEEIWKQL